ncbi:MAG: hypothetical protein ACYTBZ_02860 [Planctomycetota bacterium]
MFVIEGKYEMIKLYKRIDGKLHYHEAWCHEEKIVEHWGVVGNEGETCNHKIDPSLSVEENINRVLAPTYQQGFEEIDIDDHAVLLVEYAVDEFGTNEDLSKRYALEDKLNELLGWTGLGLCDGGSIGSGTMEACCFIVDYDIAKCVVRESLKETEFADYSRIYREDE